ncbi:MAG: energy transducer TonB [Polyangiaceae bacterium]|jgi:protein TonB
MIATRNAAALVGSLALHVAITVALAPHASAEFVHPDPPARMVAASSGGVVPIDVEMPTVADSTSTAEDKPAQTVGEPPRAFAGPVIARPDTGVVGRGGDDRSRAAALNLADSDEQIRLSPDVVNRLDRDQLQRLRVGSVRASWEDRRSTTHPAELTFVVTGAGAVRERRPAAPRNPSRGALASPRASSAGAVHSGASALDDAFESVQAGARLKGSRTPFPGLGLPTGTPGDDHRASSFVGEARPFVTTGPVSIPASEHARTQDDVDSEQEVATTVRALVHASSRGGIEGAGEGGSGGGGPSGADGLRGAGSLARPLGVGEGEVVDYWTSDPRLLPYFRKLHARIDPLWAHAFPKSALLELKQGTVIVEFTVWANGEVSVTWPPARASGVAEFDWNCAEAIRRAGPFPPIPRELGVQALRVRAPFVASNPIVK